MSLRGELLKKWKPRNPAAHKGDYGRIFILAGSSGFSGAASLAGLACLRGGAGLVTLGVPSEIHSIVARRQPELMVRPLPSFRGSFSVKAMKPALTFLKNQSVLAIGPGLSQEPRAQKFCRGILGKTKLPVVIDADALNALKNHTDILSRCRGRAILTPHPGEFTRLFGGKLSPKDSERKDRAVEAAKSHGVIVILKGRHTVVADPSGKVYVNCTGNPGMAKGGSGDVLTGILAALLGQKFSLWDAARFGVYLHGLAGDIAVKKKGRVSLIATDIIQALPEAFRRSTRAF